MVHWFYHFGFGLLRFFNSSSRRLFQSSGFCVYPSFFNLFYLLKCVSDPDWSNSNPSQSSSLVATFNRSFLLSLSRTTHSAWTSRFPPTPMRRYLSVRYTSICLVEDKNSFHCRKICLLSRNRFASSAARVLMRFLWDWFRTRGLCLTYCALTPSSSGPQTTCYPN